MRARGLPSLDLADALAYAFAYVDVAPVDVESHGGESIMESITDCTACFGTSDWRIYGKACS